MSNRSDTISSLFMAPPSALSADNKHAEAPRRVAAGSVRSLQNTFSDVERENAELRQRLDAGEVIVEIDPADIAPSPFRVAGNAPVPSGGAHRCLPDHSPRQPEWEALRPQGQGRRDRARSCGGEETGSGVAAWDGARNAQAPLANAGAGSNRSAAEHGAVLCAVRRANAFRGRRACTRMGTMGALWSTAAGSLRRLRQSHRGLGGLAAQKDEARLSRRRGRDGDR